MYLLVYVCLVQILFNLKEDKEDIKERKLKEIERHTHLKSQFEQDPKHPGGTGGTVLANSNLWLILQFYFIDLMVHRNIVIYLIHLSD